MPAMLLGWGGEETHLDFDVQIEMFLLKELDEIENEEESKESRYKS